MATEVSYDGNNSNKDFTITFPFLKDSHVKASVGGVTKNVTTDYSISGTTVTFVTAPPSGTDNVKLYRDTPITAAEHDYSAGSSIKADALNENQKQLLYAIEEAKLVTVTSGGITTGAKNDVTVNSDTDWVINANSIEQSMMATNSVGLDEIKPNSVGSSELVDNSVTLDKMAGGTDGQIITYDASGDPVAVGPGNDGEVLTSTGAGSPPAFEAIPTQVPVGTVIWYAGSTAPAGYLKCNGDTIANGSGTTQSVTANFSALYAIVGSKLPDLRGEFIRGIKDGRSGVDETGSTAHTGSGGPTFTDTGVLKTQTEAFKSHDHDVTDPGHTHTGDVEAARHTSGSMGSGDTYGLVSNSSRSLSIDSADTDLTVDSEGGTETRPRNVALLACIKY